jgi:predicted regulator of Ras-like GTPase activity (Roadblock/LC7/MglB family)
VRMAPKTFLSPDAEMLATMVNLPLQEILPKIKTLPRRAEQRVVEVPEDLQPVFGASAAGDTSKAVQPVATPSASVAAAPLPTSAPSPAVGLNIPPPTTRAVPVPESKTIPASPLPPGQARVEKTVAAPQPTKSEETYAPPAPKPLPIQAPISLQLPTPAPAPPPAATPPVAVIPTAVAPEAPVIPLGAVFGQPDKTDWTPQEVVEKAAALRGVAGALITTTDGLPVAFHLPSDLSGNMVAAFVPQLFMRVVQYTRDLKLGDAKHITILVENVPLQIFKSGGVYFTALGRANENLPKPQLTAIALALGRQSPA